MSTRTIFPIAVVIALVVLASCGRANNETTDAPVPSADVIRIDVSDTGFAPKKVNIAADQPAVLEFVRTSDKTCATAVVFQESGLRHELPLNDPVRVTVRPTAGQRVSFTCPMNMYSGSFGVAETAEEMAVASRPNADGNVEIEVDAQGFNPKRIQVAAGETAVLRFTQVADKTCNTGVLIPDLGIEASFVLNEAVDVTISPETPGEYTFSCPMNMSTGIIEVVDGTVQ